MNPVETLESLLKADLPPKVREEVELVLVAGTLEEQEETAARVSAALASAAVSRPVMASPTVKPAPSRKTLNELKRRERGAGNAPPEARAALAATVLDAGIVKRVLLCKDCVVSGYYQGQEWCFMRGAARSHGDRACEHVRARKEARR